MDTLGAQVRTKFQNGGVEFYVFDDLQIAQELFRLNAQNDISWAKHAVFIWSHPGIVQLSDLLTKDPDQRTTVKMGLQFDVLMASSLTGKVNSSKSVEFDRVVSIDHAYISAQIDHKLPVIGYDKLRYKDWALDDSTKRDLFAVLFAERFAELFAESHPNIIPPPYLPIYVDSIQPYYVCSEQYVSFLLANGRPPVAGTSDYATPLCR